MMNRADLVLVFGATGKTGFHIANALISSGYAVRVVARSKTKVSQLFKEKEISFQKIVEGKLTSDDTLRQAFQPSQIYGRVRYVVSALGYSSGSKQSVQQVEYLSQVRIIQKCKQEDIQKYVIITSIMMERPWNPIPVLLGTLVPGVFVWKTKAQNYLRRSGLNYAIIRPSGLVGDQKNTTVTPYQIDQGDKIGGRITRATVAAIVNQTIKSTDIPQKVTFECTGVPDSTKSLTLKQLKADTQQNIVTANHRTPKYVYGFILFSLLALGTYAIISKLSG